jgi:DNA polymerase II large subunit
MFSSNFANSTQDHWVVIKTTKATLIKDETKEETMEDLDTLGIDPEYLEPEKKEEEPKAPLTIDQRLDNIDSSLENIQVTMDTMLKVFQQVVSKLKEMGK